MNSSPSACSVLDSCGKLKLSERATFFSSGVTAIYARSAVSPSKESLRPEISSSMSCAMERHICSMEDVGTFGLGKTMIRGDPNRLQMINSLILDVRIDN